jgi:hypothetical protein
MNRVIEAQGETDSLTKYRQGLLEARPRIERFGLLEIPEPAIRVAAMSVWRRPAADLVDGRTAWPGGELRWERRQRRAVCLRRVRRDRGRSASTTIFVEHLGSTGRLGDEGDATRRRIFDQTRFPSVLMKVRGLGEICRRAMPVAEPFSFVEPIPLYAPCGRASRHLGGRRPTPERNARGRERLTSRPAGRPAGSSRRGSCARRPRRSRGRAADPRSRAPADSC